MKHSSSSVMTVDVEDYFQVSAFSNNVNFSDWGTTYPLRVEKSTHRILDIFSQHDVKATFFVLGWVAEACPQLVRHIVDQGHELASHGYAHQRANQQTADVFKQDVYRSKAFLEDTSGQQVLGYRAPSFSIDPSNEWAFQVLKELGFIYSSSTYPVKHDLYGAPDWPRHKYLRPEGIVEIPIPTTNSFGKSIPIGGGGFFRLYPYALSKYLINKFLTETNKPYSFYFHPWEIDHDQPKMKNAPLKSKVRHYLNLHRMENRLNSLLSDFNWDTMSNVYQLNGQLDDSRSEDQENN
ncbi:XrtA system polysaccharide deacetylase [Vibrio sp. MA40-2]|uniref:XrtA system polysaccharide deacetylase n=1 Tax=Vibrio sp. MA40-2 TaxID=3391828 RepID=UPI0039A58604